MSAFLLEELVPGRAGEAPAILVAGGETWTRERLRFEAHGWKGALGSLQLGQGDAVAIWAANSPLWIAAALGIWSVGGVVVPISPRWTDAEMRDVVERASVRLLVGDGPLVERAQRYQIPTGRLDEPTNDRGLDAPLVGTLRPERLAALVPTSGTTGTPKLAMLAADGLGATAALTAEALGLGPGDVYWLPMPLSHVGGLGAVCRALGAGAAIALPGPDAPEDPLAAWEACGVTHASLVPTQLRDLTAAAVPRWPASLRAVMVGGAAPPADLAARCPTAWATYGLTEAGGTVTLSPAREAGGTSGRPLPSWEVTIRGAAGEHLSAGRVGEVWLRGPGLMRGYLGDAQATAAALVDGWLRTGDLGELDGEGGLTLHARRTDLIVTGGENVYPAEVEAALLTHPDLGEVAVVGEPDPRWGQRVVACVAPRQGATCPGLEALRTALAPRLASYKHPRRLVVLDALPRLTNGKLDRVALRAQVEGGGRV